MDGAYELAYSPSVVEKHGSGAVLLSNSLPARVEPYSVDTTRAYVEGLLPQGRRRRRIAAELGVDPSDGYALIAALGGDCAGAVSFVAERPMPRDRATGGNLLDRAGGRIALGGDRHKLGLLRRGFDDGWRLPCSGLPSTHVVKPEPDDVPELVANEMFCMTVFRQAGLPAAKTTMETIDGRDCLVSRRFDLAWQGGRPRRLHQENFCQALGIAPAAGPGGRDADAPGFAEACGLLRALGLESEVSTLVHAAFANYVLGNGDAHGRNVALVFRGDRIEIVFYDVTSTLVYDSSIETGMVLPDDFDVTTYLRGLCRVAEECGIDLEIFHIQASCALKYICDAIEVVAESAEDEGWHAPVIDRIFEIAQDRAGRCAERLLLWDHFDM